MKRLFVLLVGALVLAACSGGKDAVDQGAGGQFRYHDVTARGKTIPVADRRTVGNVSGELLGGGMFSLAAQKGKVVVLNFWGSWCAPCRSEAPTLAVLSQEFAKHGVSFIGDDVGDTPVNALTFTDDALTGVSYAVPPRAHIREGDAAQ